MSYEIVNNLDEERLVVDCLPFVAAQNEFDRLKERYPNNLYIAVTLIGARVIKETEIAFDFISDENSVLPFK